MIEVSVVIPTYNRKDSLKMTIDSVTMQDYQKEKYEILVVDDGSTDGTSGLCEDYGHIVNLRCIQQTNAGPTRARNRGIIEARGAIIAFIDDDCIADKKWLKNMVAGFSDDTVAGTYGKVETDELPVLYLRTVAPVDITGHKYPTCNIAYKKKVLEETNGFDETFNVAFREDSDLAYRILKKGYRITRALDAKVYHPLKKLSLFGLLKSAFNHQFDVLLYSKHPDIPKDVYGGVITRPEIGPFSISGCLSGVFVLFLYTSNKITGLELTFKVLSVLFVVWTFLFVIYGYRFLTWPKFYGKIPLEAKIKDALLLPVYLSALVASRAYGIVRFKKVFV